MLTLFAGIYFIPAAFLSLGIWMLLQLLREIGVQHKGRRIWFVVFATVLLTPTVVPAGIIMTAFVPNGILALSGSLPMLHQPRLVLIAGGSFPLTAAVAWLAARLFINDKKQPPVIRPRSSRMARIALPTIVIGALLTLYYGQIPDRKVAAHIDRDLIESVYGEQLDAVAATLEIEAGGELVAERMRLRDLFEQDETIVAVRFDDHRLLELELDASPVFTRSIGASSHSCSSTGDGKYRNEGLMRCTWKKRPFGNLETLEYKRRFSMRGETHVIEIEFDYDAFMSRHPAPDR